VAKLVHYSTEYPPCHGSQTLITSDVVKVQGEDPATPGLLPKGIDPGTVTIPQYRVNKTKQHTHTLSSSSPF